MKIIIKCFLLAITVSLLSGCGTIAAYNLKKDREEGIRVLVPLAPVYAATSWDGFSIFCTFTGDFVAEGRHDLLSQIWYGCFVLPVLLIDMPISIATDTIIFPFDMYRICSPTQKVKKDEKVEETSPPTQ